MSDRPEIPQDEYKKPLPKGGDLPPLELLPDREWLGAKIVGCEYRVAMFNNQVQYLSRKVEGGEDIHILDDDGNKIQRREFNIKFSMHDYSLPNDKGPRCCWLTLGASTGEKAHLPVFLFNVLGNGVNPECPQDVIDALVNTEVKLQLSNKPNKKDPDKPPYQNVIYDAVTSLEAKPKTEAPASIKPEDIAWDE